MEGSLKRSGVLVFPKTIDAVCNTADPMMWGQLDQRRDGFAMTKKQSQYTER
jgi:hypothetical protein